MKDQIKQASNLVSSIFRTLDVPNVSITHRLNWGDLKVSPHDLKAIETQTAKGLVNGLIGLPQGSRGTVQLEKIIPSNVYPY